VLDTTAKDPRSHPETRRDGILKLVREKDVVHVNELMHVFGASRATITRDLAVLQDKGLVTKTYGAVINVQTSLPRTQVYSYGISLREHIEEKRAIARCAFPLVFSNASVVFNSGVTTFEVAKLIADTKTPVNIVTNSLEIARLFAHDVLRNVLLLGGDLAQGLYKVTGKLTCANMERVQGDMAFLGVHDIDLNEGITMPYSSEAELISVMMKRCRKKIVLADHSKFGRVSLYKVDCTFGDIDTVVTDGEIDEKYVAAFRERGVEVIVAGASRPAHAGSDRGTSKQRNV
jgi:DeoR family fructose operon transcriptional repressor